MKMNIAKLTKPSLINNFLRYRIKEGKAKGEKSLEAFYNGYGVEAKTMEEFAQFVEAKTIEAREAREAKKRETAKQSKPNKLRL